MCGTEHVDPDVLAEADGPRGMRRRDVLRAGALGAAALVLRPSRALGSSRPVSMAMHVHGSFSEDWGSWDSQLGEADSAGVDVVWATDHDWRMAAHGFLTHHSLTTTAEDGGRLVHGNGSGSVGPDGLRLADGVYVLSTGEHLETCTRGSVAGLVIGVDADPAPGSSLELRLVTSRHPGHGVDPIVVRKVITKAGRTLWRPRDTLAAILGPALAGDAAFSQLSFAGRGVLRNLTLDWNLGPGALGMQRQVLAAAAARHRAKVYQALEGSLYWPHVNWFGGDIAIPPFGSGDKASYQPDLVREWVSEVHRRGGIASYNHPLGPSWTTTLPPNGVAGISERLVSTRALGCDLLEVAYPARSGTIQNHLQVWDACSRNGLYLVGTGVSDNHTGTSWLAQPNRFATCAWADSTAQPALLSAIRSGRLFCRKLGDWAGSLDMSADGHPMGSVSPGSAGRRVRVQVDRVPTGGRVQLKVGPIDHGGTGTPPMRVVGTWRGLSVDSTTTAPAGSFARAEVLNAGGTVVGVGNPCWLPRG